MLILTLFACSDSVDAQACEVLGSDSLHALLGSTDPGLEEAGAGFHMEPHWHLIELDGPAFIWGEGDGSEVSFYTDAELVSASHDGESVDVGATQANPECAEELTTSFSLHAEEGIWEFELDGSDEYSWVAIPHEAEHDHGDHEH